MAALVRRILWAMALTAAVALLLALLSPGTLRGI